MNKSRDHITRQRQTLASVGLLVTVIVLYIYFLNISVVHVVMRKEAAKSVNELQTEIAILESAFIESQHTVAARIATLEGYNLESEKIFITRGDTSLVLREN
ncbi:MAG: hypothetical protein AAB388_01360 [Patescibacteria group bacterium]